METQKTISTRASIRDFTGEKISDEEIEKLLRAAMAAPSAMNTQPWAFVVVQDKKTLKEIADHPQLHASMAANAGTGILVCEDTDRSYKIYGPQDCAAATENLLLSAHDQSLGAVWTGVDADKANLFRQWCALPDHIQPIAFIPVGVPSGAKEPKEKFDPQKIHRETF